MTEYNEKGVSVKAKISIVIAVCGCVVLGATVVGAQMKMPPDLTQDVEKPEDEVAKHYEEVFSQAAFKEADTNNDGSLDKKEIAAHTANLEAFLDDEKFNDADRNNDGRLSIHEIRQQKHIDKEHPGAASTKLLAKLKVKYPRLSQSELRYFFKHKEQAEKLVYELEPGQPAVDTLLEKVRKDIRREEKALMERKDVQDKRLSLQEEIIDGRMQRPQDAFKEAQEKQDALEKALKHK